ncbi:hypothetical protein ACFLUS_03675 [Chloroflexota bacterium]
MPIETAKGDSRFASIGDPGLPIAVTPGLPMATEKQKKKATSTE